MSCIKNTIAAAATVCPAVVLFGCSDTRKQKCGDFSAKAQCKKGGAKGKVGQDGLSCQWTPSANATCKQNATMFEQFFNFSKAAAYFHDPKATKTIVLLEEKVSKLQFQLEAEIADELRVDIEAQITVVQERIELIKVSANPESMEVYESCALAGGNWKRQFEDAQTNATRVHPIEFAAVQDEFEALYNTDMDLNFALFLDGTGAIARDYQRATVTGHVSVDILADATKKVTLSYLNNTVVVKDAEDWNRYAVVSKADADRCHQNGGLLSSTEDAVVACVGLNEFIVQNSHSDDVDDEYWCTQVNKDAQIALYGDKAPTAPTLLEFESKGKCAVAKPCEFIWEGIGSKNITSSVHPTYKYCKAKLNEKTEDQNVQCMDISRLDSACVVDTARNTCGYYGTDTPAELKIGAGMCQFVNASAASGTCSDFVNKTSTKTATKKTATKKTAAKKTAAKKAATKKTEDSPAAKVHVLSEAEIETELDLKLKEIDAKIADLKKVV